MKLMTSQNAVREIAEALEEEDYYEDDEVRQTNQFHNFMLICIFLLSFKTSQKDSFWPLSEEDNGDLLDISLVEKEG